MRATNCSAMIRKSRIEVIRRRTLIMLAIVQTVGLLVFAFDLYSIFKGTVDESAAALVLAYAAFVAFSAVVFWFMRAIRRIVESRFGAD